MARRHATVDPATADATSEARRVHGFGSAVTAVAAGVLVVDLIVPRPGQDIWASLAQELPTFATFATSFVLVVALWVRYGAVLTRTDRFDRPTLALTTLLLLGVVALAFPTALLGRALAVEAFARSAAVVYTALVTAACLVGAALAVHADREARRPAYAIETTAPVVALVAVGGSLVDARLGLAVSAVLGVALLLVPSPRPVD